MSKRRPFHIYGKLPPRKGCKIWFKPPSEVKQAGGSWLGGEIVDEVWATPELNDSPPRAATNPQDWGDYSFCAQRITWNNGGSSIRLAYYRRRAGEDAWHFGSQMTVTTEADVMKKLLEKTLAMKDWFEAPAQRPSGSGQT